MNETYCDSNAIITHRASAAGTEKYRLLFSGNLVPVDFFVDLNLTSNNTPIHPLTFLLHVLGEVLWTSFGNASNT